MHLHAIIPAAGRGQRLGIRGESGPKSLLEVGGRPMLLRSVQALAERGVRRVSVIVGFEAPRIREALANLPDGLDVDFPVNADYASTEHGFSLYCARQSWERTRAPVLFLDADNVFDPRLLDRLIGAPAADCVLVDPHMDTAERDEETVLGEAGVITGFVRGRIDAPGCVGGFVGMNRFSPAYMERLFDFMETLFAREGRGFKYERVFHRLAMEQGLAPAYLDTGGLAWVNVNHPADLERAERELASTVRQTAK